MITSWEGETSPASKVCKEMYPFLLCGYDFDHARALFAPVLRVIGGHAFGTGLWNSKRRLLLLTELPLELRGGIIAKRVRNAGEQKAGGVGGEFSSFVFCM